MDGFSDPLADHGGWEFDLATGDIAWSPALFRIHGVEAERFELTTESIRGLVHPEDLEEYARSVRRAIDTGSPFTVQHRILRPDGDVRVVLVRGSYLPGAGEQHDRLVGTTQDVTGRQGSEERMWYLANHDSLTGLHNRRRFREELEREVAAAVRSRESGAVVIIDLDRFKDINDTLGHVAGDGLLVQVAERLRDRLRATDALARLGGDEFAVILPRCPLPEAQAVAAELIGALRTGASVRIAGLERPVLATAGVAEISPESRRVPDELMVEADLAMYRGKARGGDCVEVFDEDMRADLAARVQVEAQLRDGLRTNQFEVHYQPIVSLEEGNAVGFEALVRWRHPERGLLAAGEFIEVAEQHGLIGEIGQFVLAWACAEARSWRHTGTNAYVSVNVSPLELVHDDVVGNVRDVLGATGLAPQLLQLEVTETSLIGDATKIAPALGELRDLGVRIAIDDFGGGTSSLNFLSALPIDVIKIDRLFVEGMLGRVDDRAIVAAVLSLAEELELTVVAEGVESQRQQAELRELGCRFAQGFLYSRPVPPDELSLDAYSAVVQPGVGDPSVIREFMRQIGIPARMAV
jgi:diguanylate cyclase (GGDEF)-like protein/PAS domain S-box-containing protein